MRNYNPWIDAIVLVPFAVICAVMWFRSVKFPTYIAPGSNMLEIAALMTKADRKHESVVQAAATTTDDAIAAAADLYESSNAAFEQFKIDEAYDIALCVTGDEHDVEGDMKFAYRMGFIDGAKRRGK